jgi:hypothetical protein
LSFLGGLNLIIILCFKMKIILRYEKKIYFWPNILENNILT